MQHHKTNAMKKMLLSLAVLGFAAAAGAQTPPKPEKIIVIDALSSTPFPPSRCRKVRGCWSVMPRPGRPERAARSRSEALRF